MPKVKDVVAIVGEYNGKPKYKNVGALIEKNGKQYIKMNSLAFHEDGHICNFFSLYEPRDNSAAEGGHRERGAATRADSAVPNDFDDDIPF